MRRSSYPIGVAVEATTGTATRRRGTPGRAIRYAADRAFRAAGVDRSTTFEVNDIVAAAEPVRKRPGRPRHARADRGPLPRSSRYRFHHHAPRRKVMVVRPPGKPAVAALPRHIA
ncbi:hypothetical protein ACFCV8_20610 [Streptomyces sp. NPDC056347]|uniref:hypothetical protein n=1 Tax=Streptomyces sp. NPDC056347 TaxID=3345790 RepID=UPI0035E057F3